MPIKDPKHRNSLRAACFLPRAPRRTEPGAAEPIVCPLGAVGMWRDRNLRTALVHFLVAVTKQPRPGTLHTGETESPRWNNPISPLVKIFCQCLKVVNGIVMGV